MGDTPFAFVQWERLGRLTRFFGVGDVLCARREVLGVCWRQFVHYRLMSR